MKKIKNYQNKKVLVLGLGKSGVSAARLLNELGALVTVNDAKNFDDSPDAQALVEAGIRVITGSHPLELLDEDFELMVKNPGIHYDNPMVKKAIEKKIPIITEPELAFEISAAPMIGVTGTNGKTTTTTMITEMINENRKVGKAYANGNIGIPSSEVAQKVTPDDVLVSELSSFQLAGVTKLRPHIAVLTNIYVAHLDFHGSRTNYVNDKMNIVKQQTANDFLIVNWDLPELRDLSERTKGHVIPFSRKEVVANGAYVKDDVLYFNGTPIINKKEIKVPGSQNVENALAALAAAMLMGQTPENIAQVLKRFSGVEHRLQFVKEWKDRRFYNDSKSTNVESTEVAMRSFDQPEILLAGGLDRGLPFDDLIPDMKKHVKAVITFGQTGPQIAEVAKQAGIKQIIATENVVSAVPIAFEISQPGDVILLSPANASWDQYPNMEKRGEMFIDAINDLTEGNEE